ncbi:hypothetical protein [Methylobacterium sp. J-090]|uniref:hypothetical protein n=1 Tax=Methylobacterium sp. J-090 TaxID=2836666 RepID=UPI001FB9BC3D|nr:hypothetical protein [Methylobacterium sp. J-090]MCJ2081209.1 hypothetical protein [Methylobacterium sp. J-090]
MAMPSLAPLHLKRHPTDGLYACPAPILEADEHTPDSAEDWRVTSHVRPDTPHVRAPRFLDLIGEMASALLIIAGGVAAYGFAHLA